MFRTNIVHGQYSKRFNPMLAKQALSRGEHSMTIGNCFVFQLYLTMTLHTHRVGIQVTL